MKRIVTTLSSALFGVVIAAFVAFALLPAYAVLPSEQLADPKLEARARAISQELRCVVCQNETIDDSDADLAHDLRIILRERLKAGDTDEQAISFIVKRYGSYVLLKPPFRAETLLLWIGPLFALMAGGLGVTLYWRKHAGDTAPLTAEEEAQLKNLSKADS